MAALHTVANIAITSLFVTTHVTVISGVTKSRPVERLSRKQKVIRCFERSTNSYPSRRRRNPEALTV